MLTEKTIIDKIEVLENGYIQIRQANIIEKNGIEITRTFHRWVLAPGQDLENQEQKVKDIANVVWTKEIIETYKESLKNIETK
jgi:hypothetical protein